MAAAAGVAAVGYYFYSGKNAKKHRQVVSKWAGDFKRDVVRQAKELKNLDRAALAGIVDGVAKAYEGVRTLDRKDLSRAAAELKDNWQKLREELAQTGRLAGREAGKTFREAAKSARDTAHKVTSKVRKTMRRK